MAPAPTERLERAVEREPNEMDFLGELNAPDILQVMKNFGAGDADAMFPLVSGELHLLDEHLAQEEAAGARERVAQLQARIERRCEALVRRVRWREARATGRHAAEETCAVFERALRPRAASRLAARALLERLETAVALPRRDDALPPAEATPADEPGAATSSGGSCVGALRSHVALERRLVDEDATESSSGAESCDEAVPYFNQQQYAMPITKRAMWKWAQERASIASRWTWLQAQIQDLDHKIKQHTEIERRVRLAKGGSILCEPSGYTGHLPGHSGVSAHSETCARVRSLNRSTFRKRKLLQMHNLHTAAEKAARPSNIRCICQWPLGGCAVCTGRVLPMHPLPASSTLTKRERIALVDPAFHPVLSFKKEISTSVQYSALMKNPQWQQKCSKTVPSKSFKTNIINVNKPLTVPKLIIPTKRLMKKKKNKSKRGRSNLIDITKGMQFKRRLSVQDNKYDFVERSGSSPQMDHAPLPSGGSSPVPSPSDQKFKREKTERNRLNSSYDIDNIVIPHSIAASTKLEILQYKEILTPKWRIVEPEEIETPNNGIIRKPSQVPQDEKENEVEDVSEATIVLRHEMCEKLEKGKYLQKRKSSRRHNSRSGTGSNPPLTPSETPPHTPATMVDETSMHSESGMPSTPITLTNLSSSVPCTSTQLCMTLNELSNSASCNTPQANTSMSIGNKRRLTLQMDEVEIIPPYSPRAFPLSDEIYSKMLTTMPENHPLSHSDLVPCPDSAAPSNNESDVESSSGQVFCIQDSSLVDGSDAVMDQPSESDGDTCSVPPDEDPNDPEWNVSAHGE